MLDDVGEAAGVKGVTVVHAVFYSSWPGLSRPSTPLARKRSKGNIDARDIGERLCPGMTTIGLLR
jgi:hypothetical protein